MPLGRVPKLDTNSAVIIGTVEYRRKVMLTTTWQYWFWKASPLWLISCHAVTECDTTRHIQKFWIRDASQPSLKQASQFLLHVLNLEKTQNHQLRWSRDVKSYCAQSSALNNSTYPKQRLHGGISSNNIAHVLLYSWQPWLFPPNSSLSRKNIVAIFSVWSRCHRLSVYPVWVCTGQSSHSDRASAEWQSSAVTPQFNPSFSFVSRFSKHLIEFIAIDS